MTAVLDASACLAYLQREAGAEVVAEVLTHGAYISAVNLAEVLSKLESLLHTQSRFLTFLSKASLLSCFLLSDGRLMML